LQQFLSSFPEFALCSALTMHLWAKFSLQFLAGLISSGRFFFYKIRHLQGFSQSGSLENKSVFICEISEIIS